MGLWCRVGTPLVQVVARARRAQDDSWGALFQPCPAHHLTAISPADIQAQEAGNKATFTGVISAPSSTGGSERIKARRCQRVPGKLHHDRLTPWTTLRGATCSALASSLCQDALTQVLL